MVSLSAKQLTAVIILILCALAQTKASQVFKKKNKTAKTAEYQLLKTSEVHRPISSKRHIQICYCR